jgi:hypothetical protein
MPRVLPVITATFPEREIGCFAIILAFCGVMRDGSRITDLPWLRL